ncbi:hypothetical protein SDC9_207399 [bioreactor metagenome]|uniref:Uncharacterized protein n=1 Tax=bioreactor metagenome TaxID=1076179 RepID=A0A645J8G9_9ZZZZ
MAHQFARGGGAEAAQHGQKENGLKQIALARAVGAAKHRPRGAEFDLLHRVRPEVF